MTNLFQELVDQVEAARGRRGCHGDLGQGIMIGVLIGFAVGGASGALLARVFQDRNVAVLSEPYIKEHQDIQAHAVANGYAEWAVSGSGNRVFTWKMKEEDKGK